MASPLFTINGGSVGEKASVSASASVTFQLDSIAGVSNTEWTVLTTDESAIPADYTPSPSGSVNQTMTLDALLAGTAAIVKCQINGGIDQETGQASDAMWTTAKFYVPDAYGLEVLCAGELDDASREASATHGAVEPINEDIRASGGYKDSDGNVALVSIPSSWELMEGGLFFGYTTTPPDGNPTSGMFMAVNASNGFATVGAGGILTELASSAAVPSTVRSRFGTTTTADATPESIDLLGSGDIANGEILVVVATVTARDQTSGDSNGYIIKAVFEKSGGTLLLIGADDMDLEREEDATWDAELKVNSGAVAVEVTGDGTNSVLWKVRTDIFQHTA
jgi:hypothetical protein